jgi:hypothetical protein
MQRSHRNATVLLFTCGIRRSDRSHMNNLFLAVGRLGILFIRTCVDRLCSLPDPVALCAASSLPTFLSRLSALLPVRRHLFSFGFLLPLYSYALVIFCWFSSVVASRWQMQKVLSSLPKHVLAADYCCGFMDNLEKREEGWKRGNQFLSRYSI